MNKAVRACHTELRIYTQELWLSAEMDETKIKWICTLSEEVVWMSSAWGKGCNGVSDDTVVCFSWGEKRKEKIVCQMKRLEVKFPLT